jgi:hypothetical protein
MGFRLSTFMTNVWFYDVKEQMVWDERGRVIWRDPGLRKTQYWANDQRGDPDYCDTILMPAKAFDAYVAERATKMMGATCHA